PIFGDRLNLAVAKRCDAVDPDNVDGFGNETGFDITAEDQRAFNLWLAKAAHRRGLAIGLKNAAELVPHLAQTFDFAVVE
ncbi:endo alpha-1,4 polygalactosaminidase, partial [Desulfocurvus sp. DL9XJH121]